MSTRTRRRTPIYTRATKPITELRRARIESAHDLSLADLAVFSGISRNKLAEHLKDAVDPLPSFNIGRKHLVSKQAYLAWRERRFSTSRPDPAIAASRRRRWTVAS